MPDGTRVADVSEVPDSGSYLFTAEDGFTNEREVILVPCEDDPGIEAWVNTCTHESQSLDTGSGAAMREGQIICPKHGSLFDACSGECDNGEAAGTTLLNGKYYQSTTQLFLFRAGGAGVLAAMVSSDVFAHEVQNATFGPEVRIVAPGGKQLITLEG